MSKTAQNTVRDTDTQSAYVSGSPDAGYRLSGSRVSLASVVYAFLRGETPETVVQNFPTLELEQVYGAIAFYLSNQEVIDTYLEQGEHDFERLREEFRRRNPKLRQKLLAARQQRLQHA